MSVTVGLPAPMPKKEKSKAARKFQNPLNQDEGSGGEAGDIEAGSAHSPTTQGLKDGLHAVESALGRGLADGLSMGRKGLSLVDGAQDRLGKGLTDGFSAGLGGLSAGLGGLSDLSAAGLGALGLSGSENRDDEEEFSAFETHPLESKANEAFLRILQMMDPRETRWLRPDELQAGLQAIQRFWVGLEEYYPREECLPHDRSRKELSRHQDIASVVLPMALAVASSHKNKLQVAGNFC